VVFVLGRVLSRELNLVVRDFGSADSGLGRGRDSPIRECFLAEDEKRLTGCEMALHVEGVQDYVGSGSSAG